VAEAPGIVEVTGGYDQAIEVYSEKKVAEEEQKLISKIVESRADYIKNPRLMEPSRSRVYIRQGTASVSKSRQICNSTASKDNSESLKNRVSISHTNPYHLIPDNQPSRNKLRPLLNSTKRARTAAHGSKRVKGAPTVTE